MFSQTTEYALRAVVTLAGSPERTLTTLDIAEATQVPRTYLAKVLQLLTRAGLLVAVRGIRGGYQLSRRAESISVLDVVNAVEPLGRIRQCPLGLPQHEQLCPLHRQIDEAVCLVEQQMAARSIAEMVDPQSPLGFTGAALGASKVSS